MEICTADSRDLSYIYELYQKSFPDNERKPFSIIEQKTAEGDMEILLIKKEGKRAGLAVTAVFESIVLLDYFAVDEAFRGQGIGSEALLKLQELYGDRDFFLEIEREDANAPNNPERIRRKAFYQRNRMQETGILIELFKVEMEILTFRAGLTYEACEKLYRKLYGSRYENNVKRIG